MTAEAGDESRGAGPGGKAAVPARGDLLDGLLMSWSGDVPLHDLLAAARRQLRQRAGEHVPAWEEPDARQSDVQRPEGRDAQRSARHSHDPDREDPREAHGRSDPHDVDVEDPYGDDELLAAELAASSAMPPGTPVSDPAGSFPGGATTAGALPVGTLAGHARLTPGPALAGWLSGASPDALDDAALVNSVTGWRKVTSWAQAQELAAIAELGRRRGVTCEVAPDRTPVEELAADFAPNEVALALTLTQCAADYWMILAVSLASRLPATLAALRSGKIDLGRAKLIDQCTTPLDSELAGKVEDRVLAKAEHQTTGQLRASLQRAVISVDPEAAERRRKQAEQNARVELTGEPEGTASLFGRYLPAAQAAAAWARVSAIATALEKGGAAGSIDLLRAQVFIRLLLGAPLVPPGAAEPSDDAPDPPGSSAGDSPASPGGPGLSAGDSPASPGDSGPSSPGESGPSGGDSPPSPDGHGPEDGGSQNSSGPSPDAGSEETSSPGSVDPGDGGSLAPDHEPSGRGADIPGCSWPGIPSLGELPGISQGALNAQAVSELLTGRPKLSVLWRTLAGLSGEPGQLGRLGPVTATVARDLAEAAVVDQTCEWRIIVVGLRGQPLAVTRIRAPGRPRPLPAGQPVPGPLSQVVVTVPSGWRSGPDSSRRNPWTGKSGIPRLPAALRRILIAAEACDSGDNSSDDAACTHVRSVPGYRVPPRLRAFLEARDQDCGYPTCRRAAASCDIDHTIPYHLGGLTCECNTHPHCRRHHRLKGTGAWRLEQPRPGVLRWTTPSRLTHTVYPEPLVA